MSDTNKFFKRLADGVVIGDGAMGSMLYERGAFLNTCFDELNLTRPQMVREIHEEYVKAGVDFIETNTFGASEMKLGKFGLAEKVVEINQAAVALARAAAKDRAMVAGAIGPLGVQLPPYGNFDSGLAGEALGRQAAALAEAGVDFFVLETFTNIDELILAINAVHGVAEGYGIVAQCTVNENHETIYGDLLEDAIRRISQLPYVTAVGINCSIGPAGMLHALERIRPITDKPISIMPNAGLPREVEGRRLYMSTPEYMAEYAKRFFEKGARIIGGCCGTTPEHLAEIVKAVRPLAKMTCQRPVSVAVVETRTKTAQEQAAVPLAEKSKIGEKLVRGEKVTSIEITPPRGFNLAGIIAKAKLCAEYGIDAINIPDGPRASSRLSPMITAINILQNVENIEPILHVCCRDRNLISLQSDMFGAYAIGLRNMLLITGDPPKLGDFPDATAVFDLDAIGLTNVVRNMNHGIDIAGNSFSPPVALTICVGANPVAADLEREIERFKKKVDAGAEYAITQPVFEPKMLLEFMEATKSHRIPIVAGIWPFTSFKNAEFMANEVPGVVVPEALLKRMSAGKTREAGIRIGIEIAREMIETISPYVAGFAISAPFGNVKIALASLGKIGLDEVD
jgi:methionine synthase I (cobalamin-dependent)/5,10-methylenetetrahydrofolate reductase